MVLMRRPRECAYSGSRELMPVSPKHHAGSDGERSVASGKQKALLSAVTAVLFSPEDDRQRLHAQAETSTVHYRLFL